MLDRFYHQHYSPQATLRRAKQAIEQMRFVKTLKTKQYARGIGLRASVKMHGDVHWIEMWASNRVNKIEISFPMAMVGDRVQVPPVIPGVPHKCKLIVKTARRVGGNYWTFELRNISSRLYVIYTGPLDETREGYLMDILTEICRV
jgi:hypothetical protein